MSTTDQRRALLRAMNDDVFNESLAWLLANGLVVFVLTHDSVDFKLTAKGRLHLAGAEAFSNHPSGAPA